MTHPGKYIKTKIIPKGLTVTKAAEILGVGRPALSNLLNGNSSLSQEMAQKIAKAFKTDASNLLRLQAEYVKHQLGKNPTSMTKLYVQPFLEITATQVDNWWDAIQSRSLLSVFLRRLIFSTCEGIIKSDFPGHDNSQRHGWDGWLETSSGNAWVPAGNSGWEFGTDKGNIKVKADKDFEKSVRANSEEERMKTTFVFVTPRNWGKRKTDWEKQKQAEGQWKDVRAYDASDIEQWLEQSIPAQIWLGEKLQKLTHIETLESKWNRWQADIKDKLIPSLFNDNIARYKDVISENLGEEKTPLKIYADSYLEGFAFLHALLSNPEHEEIFNRIGVFDSKEDLNRLLVENSTLIVVSSEKEVENEIAEKNFPVKSIFIYPRNQSLNESDIVLRPISYELFTKELEAKGFDYGIAKNWFDTSNGSLTVFRRIVGSQVLRDTHWATMNEFHNYILPVAFAGRWSKNVVDDKTKFSDKDIVEMLCLGFSYIDLEHKINELLTINNTPVWVVNGNRGIVSQQDALFGCSKAIQEEHINRLFTAASYVLLEEEPSVHLDKQQRWLAPILGKTRNTTPHLRDGLLDAIAILSVNQDTLFGNRLSINLNRKAAEFVNSILSPLNVDKLEVLASHLPRLAEIHPGAFIEIIENDLENENSAVLELMKPVATGMFSQCYRSGLLWSLEMLAWSEEYAHRTVSILAKLSELEIKDNWANKPISSLQNIFCSWMPQTEVDLDGRKKMLLSLSNRYPKIGWQILLKQFHQHHMTGDYSHKPRWRQFGRGYGIPRYTKESHDFTGFCIQQAIKWEHHTLETIKELIHHIRWIGDFQEDLIDTIEEWIQNADDSDKAIIWETLRAKVKRKPAREALSKAAIRSINSLIDKVTPKNPVHANRWLFNTNLYCLDDDEHKGLSHEERDQKLYDYRKNAIQEILESHGVEALCDLTSDSNKLFLIGQILLNLKKDKLDLVKDLVSKLEDRRDYEDILRGILNCMDPVEYNEVTMRIIPSLKSERVKKIFLLGKFNFITWMSIQTYHPSIESWYWETVQPVLYRDHTKEEIDFVIQKYLECGRPRTAFHFIYFHPERTSPHLLLKILQNIGTSDFDNEPIGSHRLDDYYVKKAIGSLINSGDISLLDLASIEFKYVDFLGSKSPEIPNLQKYIEETPEEYVKLVNMVYKPDNPIIKEGDNSESKRPFLDNAYKVLQRLSLPFLNGKKFNSVAFKNWITSVEKGCIESDRTKGFQHAIGDLLATPFIHGNTEWPEENLLREIESLLRPKRTQTALHIAIFNSVGARPGGTAGDIALARTHRETVNRTKYLYPNLSKVFLSLAQSYESQGNYQVY